MPRLIFFKKKVGINTRYTNFVVENKTVKKNLRNLERKHGPLERVISTEY